MSFEFQFNGGVVRPTDHTNEKFLMFFLVGGEEVPFYQMVQNSLVLRKVPDVPAYTTHTQYGKIFIGQQGFGVQRRFYSFYFKFVNDNTRPMINIHPFSGEELGLFFSGTISFLKKSEVYDLLSPANESRKYLKSQMMMPVDVLRSLVTVDRSALKKGVRHVRIKKRR